MAKITTLDAVKMARPDPDAIVAAGELVDLRFVSGNTLSLRAAKLFCLLIQEAGIAVAEDKQHRIPYAVLNETFHKSRDELAEAVMELHLKLRETRPRCCSATLMTCAGCCRRRMHHQHQLDLSAAADGGHFERG